MKLLYIDLFCGAGGTSTGVENARHDGRQCAKVIGCVNHDANAIASHAANHPDALHFTEDIRTLELSPLTAHIGGNIPMRSSSCGPVSNVRISARPKAASPAMPTAGRWPSISSDTSRLSTPTTFRSRTSRSSCHGATSTRTASRSVKMQDGCISNGCRMSAATVIGSRIGF